jgi:response regulator RpfG family c-di-GMP phosphodiesterase
MRLETTVEAVGRELGTDTGLLLRTLAPLGEHNVEAYRHSLRVGLLAARLAAYANTVLGDELVDPRLAFFGGAWHDIGKLDIPNTVLRSKRFGEAERRVVERHATTGYARVARAGDPRVAFVVGLHHAFQARPYGLDPRQCPDPVVVQTAKVVATCDFFDALTTRRDGRYGPGERSHKGEIMTRAFPGHENWTTWLTGEAAVA